MSIREQLEEIDKNPKIKDKDQVKLDLIREESKKETNKEAFFRQIDNKLLEKFVGKPIREFFVCREKYGEQVEPPYFWVLAWLRDDLKVKKENIIKVIDTYSASDTSAFMIKAGQSLAGVQSRITETLRMIGILSKELFKFAYEMKILEERLSLIYDAEKFAKENPFKGDVNSPPLNYSEMTLKDRYINLVEGGAKNPGSVYGLGSQVGFILVPDLFFRLDAFDEDDVTRVMKQLQVAQLPTKVVEVVGRKLKAYQAWRTATKRQLEHRAAFLLTYLKQHYNAIKLQTQWLRPYLQSAKRLQWSMNLKDRPEIIAAMEQAVIEVEILAKLKDKIGEHYPVFNMYMTFQTFPETQYVPQARGEVTRHTGRFEIIMRGRSMTEDQITAYKIMKDKEEFEMIKDIDMNLQHAVSDFSESVQRYIEMDDIKSRNYADFVKMILEGKKKKEPEAEIKEKRKFSIPGADPFVSLFSGFGELFGSFVTLPSFNFSLKKKIVSKEKEAMDKANEKTWLTYYIFQKAHKMVTW